MPLSNSTYGKGPAMADLTGFADRMTAALETGIGAVNDLNDGVATGAPVNQASVNTLLKVMQDLGEIATDARTAAMEDSQPSQDQVNADANRAATTTGSDGEAAAAQSSADTSAKASGKTAADGSTGNASNAPSTTAASGTAPGSTGSTSATSGTAKS